MNEILFKESIKIVKLIYNNEFKKINSLGYCKKINVDDIQKILYEYGGILDEVDEEKYKEFFEYIEVNNAKKYITYLDLFIDGERSDLTLLCEIYVNDNDIKVIIDDLHVM